MLKNLVIGFMILLLSGCSAIEQATLPLRSEAYQLGYGVGLELKDAANGIAELDQFINGINEWTEADIENLVSSPIEVTKVCRSLFEISGLLSSTQSFSLQNTPEDKSEFTDGCIAGFDS